MTFKLCVTFRKGVEAQCMVKQPEPIGEKIVAQLSVEPRCIGWKFAVAYDQRPRPTSRQQSAPEVDGGSFIDRFD